MKHVLGVEGGGSHSHAVVADMSGALLGAGANDDPANWDDVGIAAAGAALRSCVLEALKAASLAPDNIDASVFALGGVDFPMDEQRLSGMPIAIGLRDPFLIVNDAFAALRAGTDQPFGVVVVAGNGSVVAGRNSKGDVFRSLGMGPVFGDTGSETDLANAALTAIAEAYLGRGPDTVLSRLLCEEAGVSSVIQFLEATARNRIDPVPFAPTIIRAADDGDEVAGRLLTRAGETLGATAVNVVQRLHMQDAAFRLVLAGSVFDSTSPLLVDALEACVRAVAPELKLHRLQFPPVVGAVLLAIELVGGTLASDARTALAAEVASTLARADP